VALVGLGALGVELEVDLGGSSFSVVLVVCVLVGLGVELVDEELVVFGGDGLSSVVGLLSLSLFTDEEEEVLVLVGAGLVVGSSVVVEVADDEDEDEDEDGWRLFGVCVVAGTDVDVVDCDVVDELEAAEDCD